MKVNVLGTEYEVLYKDYSDDPLFEKRSIDGYCDEISKRIVVGNVQTFPNWEDETKEYCETYQKLVLRHEIIHAFLNESGLSSSSLNYSGAWAKNEEMVDFFAIQFPKITKVFEELKII